MKIKELELRTNLLTEMKEFYVDQLCFPMINQTFDSFTVLAGSTKLTFVLEQGDHKPYYHFAMNIPMNQIEEAKEWILNIGYPLIDAPPMEHLGITTNQNIVFLQSINAYSIYFYDPSGNNVEFIARQDLNYLSDKSFTSSSIINVSEIGLALKNDLPEVMEFLGSLEDVHPYAGNGRFFQMMGDHNGLFILGDKSLTAMSWYPTQRSPEIHPIYIVIEGRENKQFQLKSYPYVIRTTVPDEKN